MCPVFRNHCLELKRQQDSDQPAAKIAPYHRGFDELQMHEDNREIPDDIRQLYADLNAELFDSSLPDGLPVYWNSGLRRALGKCFKSFSYGGLQVLAAPCKAE